MGVKATRRIWQAAPKTAGRSRWLLLAIILATSCSLAFTVALFLRALPRSAGASLNGAQIGAEPAGAEHAVTIDMKGEKRLIHTPLENPWEILQSAGLAIEAKDRIWVNGALAKLEALPDWTVPAREIKIRRAARLTIVDDGEESTVVTRADSVGAALDDAGIILHASDTVDAGAGDRARERHVRHDQARAPIKLLVDGVLIEARTNKSGVGEALDELNAPLFDLDYVLRRRRRPSAET